AGGAAWPPRVAGLAQAFAAEQLVPAPRLGEAVRVQLRHVSPLEVHSHVRVGCVPAHPAQHAPGRELLEAALPAADQGRREARVREPYPGGADVDAGAAQAQELPRLSDAGPPPA